MNLEDLVSVPNTNTRIGKWFRDNNFIKNFISKNTEDWGAHLNTKNRNLKFLFHIYL